VSRWGTLCLAAALLAGCGGDDSGGDAGQGGTARSNDGPAGVYDTSVALLDSSCEGIDVQDAVTTVEQESGSDTIELTHGETTYTAPLTEDGQFTTDAALVPVGAQTHSLVVAGTFSEQGFRASVLATVTGGAGQPCGYEVGWVGTRQQ
jgi:hypothetical protein